MRQLASELGHDGVTANCISLGELDNLPLPDDYFARYPVARAGSADDVVALLLYLVSDEAAWMTGQVLPLNGGLS
jgi:NAD(P)-dependent dehydrogenase (short-subunit alcohol dehydrogenase family)